MTSNDQPAELTAECVEWVRRAVGNAPPLNSDQRSRLAELLRPVRPTVRS